VSRVHGVGVRSIKSIRKGTAIFHGDDRASQWIAVRRVRYLPKAVRQLYEDFGFQYDGCYGCPTSFNRLTPSCFVNHSDKPNVAFDRKRGFYALRNIKFNEELTADYTSFSKVYETP